MPKSSRLKKMGIFTQKLTWPPLRPQQNILKYRLYCIQKNRLWNTVSTKKYVNESKMKCILATSSKCCVRILENFDTRRDCTTNLHLSLQASIYNLYPSTATFLKNLICSTNKIYKYKLTLQGCLLQIRSAGGIQQVLGQCYMRWDLTRTRCKHD